MTTNTLENHPERNVIRLQLRQNDLLKELDEDDFAELERHLVIGEGHKGDFLVDQGVRRCRSTSSSKAS